MISSIFLFILHILVPAHYFHFIIHKCQPSGRFTLLPKVNTMLSPHHRFPALPLKWQTLLPEIIITANAQNPQTPINATAPPNHHIKWADVPFRHVGPFTAHLQATTNLRWITDAIGMHSLPQTGRRWQGKHWNTYTHLLLPSYADYARTTSTLEDTYHCDDDDDDDRPILHPYRV